jgi:hypothetical protein
MMVPSEEEVDEPHIPKSFGCGGKGGFGRGGKGGFGRGGKGGSGRDFCGGVGGKGELAGGGVCCGEGLIVVVLVGLVVF